MRRLRVGVLIVLVLLMLLVPQLGGDYYVHVFALVFTLLRWAWFVIVPIPNQEGHKMTHKCCSRWVILLE